MTGPRRKKTGPGRGRPQIFDAAARARYLDLVASGLTYTAAAAAAGTPLRTILNATQTDPTFAKARTKARTAGTKARLKDGPHDASRYAHHGCRCPICRKAAAAARATSPDRQPAGYDADIMHLTPNPPPTTPETETFVLARAS